MANQGLGHQAAFALKLALVAKANVIGITAIVLGLVGCAMGPDYQRPDVELPAQYHHELVQDTIDNDGLVAWQFFYLDPNVRKLISYALAQNLDLEAVRSRLIAARSKVTVTDATLYPEFGLGANAERSIDSGITSTNPAHGNEFDIAGTVSWELDIWGANRRRSEAEYAHFLSAQEALNLSVISLISDVASRYYEWLDIEQRYQISVNTVQLRKKERDLAKLRKQNGVISGLQVKQAEVEYQRKERNTDKRKGKSKIATHIK